MHVKLTSSKHLTGNVL